jgi:hypothetical protein
LNALASHRPTTREGLLLIPGLGEAKINQFGNHLLKVIKQYCQLYELNMDAGLKESSPRKVSRVSTRPATRHES